ncbi:sulfated surface glycoprotein 185-like isoform X1 [Pimephales promelas]|uniref:sulfated surface glycoprotein 185-like isoform X1 n=1 Tax=Pimephales promelas TaxID=90988 RepID=UPI00195559F6|nr:sulfated surface glycoprotein 185-like isoform X1 [Pimephales promelas]
MPKSPDVMMSTEVYQQQYDVSKFLRIKPMAVGILEILIGLSALGLTIWNDRLFLLWSPIVFIIIGALILSAAITCKPRLVKVSKIFSCVNFGVAVFSLYSHFHILFSLSCHLLLLCDILILIFSLAVAATFCPCCCKPKSRPVTVSYMNTDLPANNIVLMGQPDCSATAHPGSVLYTMPTAGGQASATLLPIWGLFSNAHPPNYIPVPITSPPNYNPVPITSPPNYNPVPITSPPNYNPPITSPPNYNPVPITSPPNYNPVPIAPPPTYDQVTAALLPNNSPVPSAPPPEYQYEDLQARR